MKHHSNSSRRQAKKGALASAIHEAQRPSYSQVVEAKALARKLMGVPDMHSNSYANKERKAVLRINKIVNHVAIQIESLSRKNWILVGVHKKWLTSINKKIEATNEYRQQNALLLTGIPKVLPISWTDLHKIKSLIVVLQCKLCNRYLSNSTERRHESCEPCFVVLVEQEARKLVRDSKQPLTMAKALIKARKIVDSRSTSPPSFSTNELNPCSSTNTRGRMDMTTTTYPNMQMPKRQEVSHK